MRKLSADYIFTSVSSPLERGILVLDDDGTILDIIDTHGALEEMADLEFYNGILVPGFVNCHAHMEFSWANNLIPLHTGLPGFIERITYPLVKKYYFETPYHPFGAYTFFICKRSVKTLIPQRSRIATIPK